MFESAKDTLRNMYACASQNDNIDVQHVRADICAECISYRLHHILAETVFQYKVWGIVTLAKQQVPCR